MLGTIWRHDLKPATIDVILKKVRCEKAIGSGQPETANRIQVYKNRWFYFCNRPLKNVRKNSGLTDKGKKLIKGRQKNTNALKYSLVLSRLVRLMARSSNNATCNNSGVKKLFQAHCIPLQQSLSYSKIATLLFAMKGTADKHYKS